MKTHHIKILDEFADDVLNGSKLFEIRKNDRGYQIGDHVIFEVVSLNNTELCGDHALNEKEYEITYVLNGWGLKNGYAGLGLRPIK